jgi:hypothetical protein
MTASTAPSKSPPVLRPDEQPMAPYRSIAPLAIVAAVLGIASALVLTTPLLAPLPVAAIVASIAALRTIAGSRGELAGRVPAIAGLCLATFFLGLGLSRHLSRQSMLEQRAREMADVFMGLLQDGKSREAHQFRQTPSARITSPEAMAEHYEKNKEAAQDLQTFTSSTGIKDLIVRGRQADLKFDSVSSASRDGQSDMLVLKYSYLPAGAAESGRQYLWLHINRKYDESSKRPQWEIGGIQNTPPVGSE